MYLCNSSFTPSLESSLDSYLNDRVVDSAGVISTPASIDPSLSAEDFNPSVQQAMGANLSFVSDYIPVNKLSDFNSLVNQADMLISDQIVSEPKPTVEPKPIENES